MLAARSSVARTVWQVRDNGRRHGRSLFSRAGHICCRSEEVELHNRSDDGAIVWDPRPVGIECTAPARAGGARRNGDRVARGVSETRAKEARSGEARTIAGHSDRSIHAAKQRLVVPQKANDARCSDLDVGTQGESRQHGPADQPPIEGLKIASRKPTREERRGSPRGRLGRIRSEDSKISKS